MSLINLKNIKKDYYITLHKINRDIIGEIDCSCVDSLERVFNDIDTISLTIPKYISSANNFNRTESVIYNEVKNERILCLNDLEYFVIKDVSEYKEGQNFYKDIKAYSLEKKLSRIDISMEDIGIYLKAKDEELEIISLDEYMMQETGWSFGHIDESVRYSISETGEKSEKMRWQESVNTSWYDFLVNNIEEQFECVCIFDTLNKKVNLYHFDSFSDDIKICLTYDNYIKSLQQTKATLGIITRLTLVGSEEMDIIGATPTGYPYIENYNYFLENGEMSIELQKAIETYEKMVAIRQETWKEIVRIKQEKSKTLTEKKTDLYVVYDEIKALYSLKEAYNSKEDTVNEAIVIAQITEKNDEKVILEVAVKRLEEDIENLQASIDEIIILCKRETATDNNGDLIFNEKLLSELKEYVYCETYSNDAFLEVEDLINAGKRKLELSSVPTVSYSIDVVNFLKRIVRIGNRQEWNGDLSLGDIVACYNYDTEEEELVYLTGFSQNLKDDTLELTLSNKKFKEHGTRTISDLLGKAERSMKTLTSKRYLWNKQKYNRINL